MRGLQAFLLPFVGLLLCQADAGSAADGGAMYGPFETSSFDLTGRKVGKIRLSGGKVTVPDSDGLGPVGLVLFHSGFAGRAEYYREYASTLASWGWAVLQYDLSCWQIMSGGPCPQLKNVNNEVESLPEVLSWAQSSMVTLDPTAANRINWQDIIVGGHSVGGEVSARSAARFPADTPESDAQQCPSGIACDTSLADQNVHVKAVFLVDPVAQEPQSTPLVSPTQTYYAIVGKGSFLCAPKRLGADNFIPSASPPLTQAVHVPAAGHAQFWQAPSGWQAGYDVLCGTGGQEDATIREWTARILTGWLLDTMPPQIDQDALKQAKEENEKWFRGHVDAADFLPWRRSNS